MFIHSVSILQLKLFNSILLNAQLNNYFRLKSCISKDMLHIYGKFECKIWAVIESGAVWEWYSIKLRIICSKVQNCSKVLAGGHVRGNTKTKFTHINIQTLHVNHKTLALFFTEVCDKASIVEIMPC